MCTQICELKKLRRLTTPVLFPSPDWEVQLALKKGTIKTLEKVSADKNCASPINPARPASLGGRL